MIPHRMLKSLAMAVSILSLVIASPTAIADVEVRIIEVNFWKVFLTKTISEADAIRFDNIKKAYDKVGRAAVLVDLNTNGGDVYASLRIGRTLRAIEAMAEVKAGSARRASR